MKRKRAADGDVPCLRQHPSAGGKKAAEEKGSKQQTRRQAQARRKGGSGGQLPLPSVGRGQDRGRQHAPSREAEKRGAPPQGPASARGSSLLEKMRARLQGGRFRTLNEKLYTCGGDEALGFFAGDPSAFAQYHAGYREQVARWPRQPLDVIAAWLRERPPGLRVADFGCGDAKLAASVPNDVVSLDLVAAGPAVIACNMAHTPLGAGAVDVAVFCLSLMGTDYPSYLAEARRVLKPRGWLLIAEVRSRFDAGDTGASPLADFVAKLSSLGFALRSQDTSNRMFVLLYLQKETRGGRRPAEREDLTEWPVLKPCVYKRR